MELDLPVCHNEPAPSDAPVSFFSRAWRRLIGADPRRIQTETLDVEPLGPNRYRLIYSPGVVEGLAAGDEFELAADDPKGFRVLHRDGNLCVWFYFKEIGRNRGLDGDNVRQAVEAFGGRCDGGGNTHLVFSVPVALGFPAIEALFNDLAGRYSGSSWLFGNVYDPWDDFKPLNWWPEEK